MEEEIEIRSIRKEIIRFVLEHRHAEEFVLGFDFDNPTRYYIYCRECGDERTIRFFDEMRVDDRELIDKSREIFETIGDDRLMKFLGYGLVGYTDEGLSGVYRKLRS